MEKGDKVDFTDSRGNIHKAEILEVRVNDDKTENYVVGYHFKGRDHRAENVSSAPDLNKCNFVSAPKKAESKSEPEDDEKSESDEEESMPST